MNQARTRPLAGPGTTLRALACWIAGADLLLVALAAPFLLIPSRWTPIACIAVALPWLGRRVATGAFSVRTPADAPLALLLAMAAIGLGISVDRAVSLEAFWRLLLGLAVYYSLANAGRSDRDLRWLVVVLLIAGLGVAALTLLGTRWQAVRLAAWPQLYDRLPALLRDPEDSQAFNPRVMGMAVAILLPVLAGFAAFGQDRGLRLAAGAIALLMALVLPLTQALQGLLALAGGVACLALWRSRWFLLTLLPASALVAWAASRLDLRSLALTMLSPGDVAGIGVALRLDIWSRGLAMVRDMPFTGIGLNTFPQVQTHFYPGYLIGPEPHAHNLFLQIALDLGLPGLAAFLMLLVAAVQMAVAVRRGPAGRTERSLAAGALAGIVAYLGAGLIDSPWTPKPGILLWLVLGTLALVFARVTGRAETPVVSGPRRRRVGAVAILTAVAVLGPLAWALATPGLRERNLGALQAHRGLYAAREHSQVAPAALAAAAGHLQAAAHLGAADSHVYSLLGSLYAWRGEDAAALAAITRQVTLDSRAPMAEYAPFEALRRTLSAEQGSGAAADLLQVYTQWVTRFPTRAEPYVAAALVQAHLLNIPDGTAATLDAATAHDAQPAGLLAEARLALLGGPK